jgi:hypothetical protein
MNSEVREAKGARLMIMRAENRKITSLGGCTLKLNRGPVFADDGTERFLLQFCSSAFGNDLVFSHIMTLPCASTFTRNEDKNRAIGSSRATDSDSYLALGCVMMIAFFSLMRDD